MEHSAEGMEHSAWSREQSGLFGLSGLSGPFGLFGLKLAEGIEHRASEIRTKELQSFGAEISKR